MAAAAERFVQLPGVRLYTRTVGRGEPLLVLHGGPAPSHPYLFPGLSPEGADALAQVSFDVYRVLGGDRGEFAVTGVLRNWDRLRDLPRIRVPTLILLGRYDLTSVETAREMSRRIPRSRVVVFEDSGHFMYLEEPEKFLGEVRGFLKARRMTGAPRPGPPGRRRGTPRAPTRSR